MGSHVPAHTCVPYNMWASSTYARWCTEFVGEKLCYDAAGNGNVEEDEGVADGEDVGEQVGLVAEQVRCKASWEDDICHA